MNNHITKPVDPDQLMRTLVEWIKPGKRQLAKGYIPPTDIKDKELARKEFFIDGLPGLDMKKGLAQVSGNRKLYRKLLGQFQAKYLQTPAQIRKLKADGQMEAATRTAHTMKGVAANLGALEVARASEQVEKALKYGSKEMEQLLEIMAAELDIVAKSLEQISFEQVKYELTPTPQVLDIERVKELLTKLSILTNEDLPKALEVAEELETIVADGPYMEQIKMIIDYINDIEPDQACAVAMELTSELNKSQDYHE